MSFLFVDLFVWGFFIVYPFKGIGKKAKERNHFFLFCSCYQNYSNISSDLQAQVPQGSIILTSREVSHAARPPPFKGWAPVSPLSLRLWQPKYPKVHVCINGYDTIWCWDAVGLMPSEFLECNEDVPSSLRLSIGPSGTHPSTSVFLGMDLFSKGLVALLKSQIALSIFWNLQEITQFLG